MANLHTPQTPVPEINSAANTTTADAVGNKGDGHDGDSLHGKTETLLDHGHSPSLCYPTLADGVVVAGAAGVWTLGDFVEIVPASTITEDFDIHFVSIEAISANDIYQLHLYAVEVFIGCVRFVKNAGLAPTIHVPIQTPIVAANSQIQAKLATSGGGADTATISAFYHVY